MYKLPDDAQYALIVSGRLWCRLSEGLLAWSHRIRAPGQAPLLLLAPMRGASPDLGHAQTRLRVGEHQHHQVHNIIISQLAVLSCR